MNTPTYEAKKQGDEYVLQRVDTTHRFHAAGWTLLGSALALYGIYRRDRKGAALIGVGSLLGWMGSKGQTPTELIKNRLKQRRNRKPEGPPTYRHDGKPRAQQTPMDQVEEASMESFPASDAPAHAPATSP